MVVASLRLYKRFGTVTWNARTTFSSHLKEGGPFKEEQQFQTSPLARLEVLSHTNICLSRCRCTSSRSRSRSPSPVLVRVCSFPIIFATLQDATISSQIDKSTSRPKLHLPRPSNLCNLSSSCFFDTRCQAQGQHVRYQPSPPSGLDPSIS